MTNGTLEFLVERWDEGDDHVVEVLAAASNLIVAQAAYDSAVKQYPKANLMLCHRARIIARSRK